VDAEEAISLLKDVDRIITTYKAAAKMPQRLLHLGFGVEEKYYVNSEGARVQARVPRVAYIHYLTAILDGQSAQRFRQEGYSGGWEVMRKIDPMGVAEEDSAVLTSILETAQPAPTGTMDVLLGPEISGLASHEACGHPQEADRVLGREGAQAGESYLKPDSLGMRIGSEEANISDDPSIPNSYGFHLYDDEGVEAVKRHLIRNGRVQEFLHNRSTAAEFELTSNSAARAVGHDREPIVRMANTFVEPGDHSLKELLEGVKLGVYMKSFMEWNIDDKRINQRYVGLEAYLVEKGQIKHLVKAPIIEITTQRMWSSVDARGKELVFKAATCGKGDPMQPCPVWTGGPIIRLRNVRVGSR
jgi:TldD protein